MLDFIHSNENTWEPPLLSEKDITCAAADSLPDDWENDGEFLIILQYKPYIDAIYVSGDGEYDIERMCKKRFVFHDGFIWDSETEMVFSDRILNNDQIQYTAVMGEIYKYYSAGFPDWKLKPYYTHPMRLLDHIYHCMIRGTAQEMLYKAGLDELAAHVIDEMDEVNLLSNRPSDIYGGISMRTLRSLNCREGARLLAEAEKREFIKTLQMKFPEMFGEKMNNSQCQYLNYLIDGDLTVGETGRLFNARRKYLMQLWAPAQYQMFLWKERVNNDLKNQAELISKIDPIYRNCIEKIDFENAYEIDNRLQTLRQYLLVQRDSYDLKFRQSNRKRNQSLQERDKGYVVRFPQTINDFCREAIYMGNCLLTYVEAYIQNDTTILFMRKTDDVNTPFITIEIFQDTLMQAYHRFNKDCTEDEADWILDYCARHKINRGRFEFNNEVDELV